jgi:hypothetical protein
MIAEGLLWFDDDPRRPFSAKMAEAARRYSERTGWQPTSCEAHPDTLALRVTAAHKVRGKAAKAAAQPEADMPHLSITPNPTLRPNYILVGVEAGKTPRRARPPKSTSASNSSATKAAKVAKVAARQPTPEEPARPPRAAAPHTSHRPSPAPQPTVLNA